MSKPRLTYFDAPSSRGEECRLALTIAGVEFEDVRIKREDWPLLKPRTPFGGLPIFELPGRPALGQSNAILALIGRLWGLHPKDDFEAARHEAILQHVEDLRAAIAPSLRIADAGEKKAAREKLAELYIPEWAASVDKQVQGPFFGGDAIHVADVKLFVIARWLMSGALDHVPPTVLSDSRKLVALVDTVGNHERVKAWYARR